MTDTALRESIFIKAPPETVDGFGLVLSLDNGWDDHLAQMRAAISGK